MVDECGRGFPSYVKSKFEEQSKKVDDTMEYIPPLIIAYFQEKSLPLYMDAYDIA